MPATLRKPVVCDWLGEVVGLAQRGELELGVLVDRLLEPIEVRRGGRAELDAGDGALAVGVPPEVAEVDPDLALGRAAAGGEEADDPVRLLLARP